MNSTSYIVIMEENEECEWEYNFQSGGHPCDIKSRFAIVDTSDKNDPDYPEGLHIDHLCSNHILPVFEALHE